MNNSEIPQMEAVQQRLLECSRLSGPELFAAMVHAISDLFGARRVYVAELLDDPPGTLRALAAYVDGKPARCNDFVPSDDPDAEVMTGKCLRISSGVRGLYAKSLKLREIGAESYTGAPLLAVDGKVLGLISVYWDRAFEAGSTAEWMVQVLAGQAGAELERGRLKVMYRRSEARLRLLFDTIQSPISFIDLQNRYTYSSSAHQRWFGFGPGAMIGRTVSEVLGPATYKIVEPYIERVLRGEPVTFERQVPQMVGRMQLLQVELAPFSDAGEILGYLVSVTDVSAREGSAEMLRKSGEQFRTLFEHLPVGAALVDSSGIVTLENDVFRSLLPGVAGNDERTSIFTRALVLDLADGERLKDEDHPVRQTLHGQVVRRAEYLCRYADGRQLWLRMSSVPVRDEQGNVTGALVVAADVHSEKRADARRTLLVNELNHRVKNTLASVQSIAAQTFRSSRSTADGLDAFESRLLALSDAHNLLTRENWEGADLRHLALLVLEPHNPGAGRLQIEGPFVRMRPAASLALAMALHELATNAVKHGALSNSTGTVGLSWSVVSTPAARRLHLTWMERGGPAVAEPNHKGFGTRLIERSLAFELASDTKIEFHREGVVCRIDADLAEIS